MKQLVLMAENHQLNLELVRFVFRKNSFIPMLKSKNKKRAFRGAAELRGWVVYHHSIPKEDPELKEFLVKTAQSLVRANQDMNEPELLILPEDMEHYGYIQSPMKRCHLFYKYAWQFVYGGKEIKEMKKTTREHIVMKSGFLSSILSFFLKK